jgi:hypothetical protein
LEKTELLDDGIETDWQLTRGRGNLPGTNQYEPLRVRKKTVGLWIKFKLVQLVSKRVELEGQRAGVKRRRLDLDETFFGGTQEQVVADIGKLLQSKAGADLKIFTSCGQVFDVHRCILAGKKWFKMME